MPSAGDEFVFIQPWCRIGYYVSNPDEIQLDVHLLQDDIDDLLQRRRAPFASVKDILNIDPEWFNEVDGSDQESFYDGDFDPDMDYIVQDYYNEEAREQDRYTVEETYQGFYDEGEQEEEYLEEEDDGLGYYPDGVKRTLTDEQIEMFRHSERHRLIKAGKLEESSESESDDDALPTTKQPGVPATTKPRHTTEAIKARSANTKNVSKREEVPYKKRNKRKWEAYIQRTDEVQGSMTHRRLVRELDKQATQSLELDYGDE